MMQATVTSPILRNIADIDASGSLQPVTSKEEDLLKDPFARRVLLTRQPSERPLSLAKIRDALLSNGTEQDMSFVVGDGSQVSDAG